MTTVLQIAQQQAADIADSPEFAMDPAGTINGIVSRAMSNQGWNHTEAKRLTWVACLLVFAANNPLVVRGDALDRLVGLYGDGRPTPE